MKILSNRYNKFTGLLAITFLVYHCSLLKVNAEESYSLNQFEMGISTKDEDDSTLDLPSNPFQLVEMIRRANSMNDATTPSDAIDEALNSFDKIEDNKRL